MVLCSCVEASVTYSCVWGRPASEQPAMINCCQCNFCCSACTNTVLVLYPAAKFSAVSANWRKPTAQRKTASERVCVRACVRAASSDAESQRRISTPGRAIRLQAVGIASRSVARRLENSPAVHKLQLFGWKRRVRAVSRGLYQGSVAARPALRVTRASVIGCTADLQH